MLYRCYARYICVVYVRWWIEREVVWVIILCVYDVVYVYVVCVCELCVCVYVCV